MDFEIKNFDLIASFDSIIKAMIKKSTSNIILFLKNKEFYLKVHLCK